METNKSADLRKKWGDNPCEHPRFEKESQLGLKSGDYNCTQCGECFTGKEYESIKNDRERQNKT